MEKPYLLRFKRKNINNYAFEQNYGVHVTYILSLGEKTDKIVKICLDCPVTRS
jgi:hypothetical protein